MNAVDYLLVYCLDRERIIPFGTNLPSTLCCDVCGSEIETATSSLVMKVIAS